MDSDIDQLSRDDLKALLEESERRISELTLETHRQAGSLKHMSKLSHRANEMTLLSKDLNTVELEDVVNIAVERISSLLHARFCSLYLYNQEKNSLVLHRHNHPQTIEEEVFLDQGRNNLISIAVAADQALLIESIPEFEMIRGRSIERLKTDQHLTKSCMVSPLMVGSADGFRKVMGVLCLAERLDGQHFDADDFNICIQLSELLGTAINNSLLLRALRELADTDGLTKLPNHRVFREMLVREIVRFKRYGTHFSMVMLDIDHFKRFNDDHGHLVGDKVLREVAAVLQKALRDNLDMPARYGGEEFAIVLPETRLSGAMIVAERLRRFVENKELIHEEQSFSLTVSLGVDEFRSGCEARDLIDNADKALYLAKHSGRNQVCFWDAEVGKPRPALQFEHNKPTV